jgi:hypothetical protein
MRTTLTIDDALYERALELAALGGSQLGMQDIPRRSGEPA